MNSQAEVDTRDSRLQLNNDSISGYMLLDRDFEVTGSPFSIGCGGSGIVYKAKQVLYEDACVIRAIKFFMYEDSILANDPNRKPVSEDDFINEIANITTFNHQSLIRVIGAGFHSCGEGKIPYIVTDFIEGPTLKSVIQPENKDDKEVKERFLGDPDLVLDFLLDVAGAIKHIHDEGHAHCDIAPKNIFIHVSTQSVRPILGDLGLSKQIRKNKKSRTRIIGSRKWMPERLHEFYEKYVDYKIFSESQPYWDLYSFSKTGLKLLEIFEDSNPRSWIEPLRKDFEKACDEGLRWSIDNLIERMEFLKPIHREVAKISELSMGVGSGRRKMMPVEAITTSKRLHDLIRHPAILRLSHVPQLTTANQILPGANHTRYEHTLGVIETMRRYLLSLLDESEFLEHLTAEKIETALLASALASATRFPLSNIIHEIKDKDKSLFEEISKQSLYLEVMDIEDSEGVALKNYIRSEFPNVRIKHLLSILCKEVDRFGDADLLIYSLLNNSLDVRVIDFVRRDSHHLGVNSGDSFQIDEILPHVTISDHKLALKVQGVSVAEQIILLRYWLFNRVYWNLPNRTFCAMARVVLLKLHEYKGFNIDFRKAILKLDQREMVGFLVSRCRKLKLKKYEDLAERISAEEHLLFKLIYDSSRVDDELGNDFDKLQGLNLNQLEELASRIWSKIKVKFKIDASDIVPVIVDYPMEPENTKMGQDVRVKVGVGKVKDLHEVSGIISGVNKSFENQLSRFRVFIHPNLKPGIEYREGCREVCRDTVKDYLKSKKK